MSSPDGSGPSLDLALDRRQRALQDRAAELGRTISAEPRGAARSGLDRAAWTRCAAIGLTGLVIDVEHGGQGLGALDAVLCLEAFGATCADGGLAFALGAQLFSVAAPLQRFGTPAQHADHLVGLCSGATIGAHALTEPGSGSDAFALATTATPTADGWRLSGSKTFCTNAPEADVLLVFATMDRARGWSAVQALLVPADAPGVTVAPAIRTAGLPGAPIGEVFLDDVAVPATALLGPRGGGLAVFDHSMGWERGCILAPAVGALAAGAARLRELGAPASIVGAAEVRARIASLMLRRMAWARDQGQRVDRLASMVKLQVAQGWQVTADAVLAAEGPGAQLADAAACSARLDAVASRIYSGTDEIQRDLLGHQLGLR